MTVNPVGLAAAFGVLAAIAWTLYWMLHPPATAVDQAANRTEADVEQLIGSVVVVFSEEIHSENMMALTARLARRARARLLAVYVIEVPHQLPIDAEMEKEQRAALSVLARAEAIARKQNVEIQTETIPARHVSQGVLDLVKTRERPHDRPRVVPRGPLHRRAARPLDRVDRGARALRRPHRRAGSQGADPHRGARGRAHAARAGTDAALTRPHALPLPAAAIARTASTSAPIPKNHATKPSATGPTCASAMPPRSSAGVPDSRCSEAT